MTLSSGKGINYDDNAKCKSEYEATFLFVILHMELSNHNF